MFFTFPLSTIDFSTTSPPHGQLKRCVAAAVREFLLAPAIFIPPSSSLARLHHIVLLVKRIANSRGKTRHSPRLPAVRTLCIAI